MSNSVANVIAVASNAKHITVTIPSRSFCEVVTIKELQMITTITDQLEVLCVFEHHSIDFTLDTNTIVTSVNAKS